MVRFILHIGQSKTGTTAIQHFLAANRGALRECGYLYPDICNKGVGLGATDHNLIAWSLIGKKSPIGVPIASFFEDIQRDLRQDHRLHTVILSAEAFMGEPHIWEFDSEAAWRKANQEKIEALCRLLCGHEVKILAYLRRQDYWVNSAFNHIIKIEGLIGRKLYSDIEDFIEHLAPRLDYAQELASWRQAFGRDALIIRPYEREQLVDCDAVSDFLVRTGIAAHARSFARPAYQESRNLGLPRDILEVKRILNRIPRSKPEERVIVWALQKIGAEMPSQRPGWDFLLSSQQRVALIQRFESSNRSVARDYLGTDQQELFKAELPDHGAEENIYPGVSPAKVLEVHLRLEVLRKSWDGRRMYISYWVGAWLRSNLTSIYLVLLPIVRFYTRSRRKIVRT